MFKSPCDRPALGFIEQEFAQPKPTNKILLKVFFNREEIYMYPRRTIYYTNCLDSHGGYRMTEDWVLPDRFNVAVAKGWTQHLDSVFKCKV